MFQLILGNYDINVTNYIVYSKKNHDYDLNFNQTIFLKLNFKLFFCIVECLYIR